MVERHSLLLWIEVVYEDNEAPITPLTENDYRELIDHDLEHGNYQIVSKTIMRKND